MYAPGRMRIGAAKRNSVRGARLMTWRRRTLWLTSIASSLILLGLVVAQIDWAVARSLVLRINYGWIAAGIGLLLIEGLVTASRFRLLVRQRATYNDCLVATAWYVLLLIGLPARLGEVAGIAVMVRHMHLRAGAAAASLLVQRVFDIIVLALLLGVVCVLALADIGKAPVLMMVAAVVAVLIALVVYLENLLALVIRPLLRWRREKWPRRFLRVALQARIVRRHHMDRGITLRLVGYTLLKWIANLAAIACVVVAVVPALGWFTAVGVGIVYNLSAVIPIQTVGGFGVSEAALLGSFSWLGYPLDVGAPIAIAVRLALISAPLLFWLVVIATVSPRVKEKGRL